MAKLPRVSVSLMIEEYSRLEWLAQFEGKRKSQIVRRFVREGLERAIPPDVDLDPGHPSNP